MKNSIRVATRIGINGWGVYFGGDAISFGNPLSVFVVATFPMWSTG